MSSPQVSKVWVVNKLPTADPVKKNDLKSHLCLLS